MKTFDTKGTFEKNHGKEIFSKTVQAESEKLAREKIYSLIGGKQKIKRTKIIIDEVKEAK